MQTKRGRLTAVRGILPMAVLCASTIGCSGSAAGTADRFYATAGPDNKLVSIEISDGSKITITPIGATGARGCGSVALSNDGTLYSVCGPGLMTPGLQQLAKIDPKTGHATLFGSEVYSLQIMGLEFAPN
jgi:outer membrane protein assembly factor BamB